MEKLVIISWNNIPYLFLYVFTEYRYMFIITTVTMKTSFIYWKQSSEIKLHFCNILKTWPPFSFYLPSVHNAIEWVSEVTQSCPTPCNHMDCSLQGSSVHGIFQARVLEWVAISFSRGSSQPRGWTRVFRIAGRCFNIWAKQSKILW